RIRTYRSPAGPPFPPLSPSPRSLRRDPVSTPPGTRTVSVWVRRRAPAPSQSAHGLPMTVPCPLHVPQVLAIVKNPCWKRICPDPPHCLPAVGRVPGLAPVPPQVAHADMRGMESVFSHPSAASSNVTSSWYWRS